MNLAQPYRFAWWHPILIALFWVLMMGLGCAPVSIEVPALSTVTLQFVPGVGRIIVPSQYQGGVQLCVQDAMQQHRFACARLVDLRRVLPNLQSADGE